MAAVLVAAVQDWQAVLAVVAVLAVAVLAVAVQGREGVLAVAAVLAVAVQEDLLIVIT